ncbi:MAG: hypothetical protein V3V16_14950 [Melioribacteraceae bacterium]
MGRKKTLIVDDIQKNVLEFEETNTFSSTINKLNHDVKQPLTLISLAASVIKREVESENLDKDAIKKRVKYIEDSVKDISKILEVMQNINNSDVKDLKLNYTSEV